MMRLMIRRTVLARGVRRLCVALLAVAVLVAGSGAGHAAADAGGHGHLTHTAAPSHDGNQSVASHQHADHDKAAKGSDSGPSSKHGAMHGCCASACSPSFTTPESTHIVGLSFSVERLTPRTDQAAASSSLEGLFRPPRRHA